MLSLSLHTDGSGRMVVVVMGGPRVCLTIKMNYPRPHVITSWFVICAKLKLSQYIVAWQQSTTFERLQTYYWWLGVSTVHCGPRLQHLKC